MYDFGDGGLHQIVAAETGPDDERVQVAEHSCDRDCERGGGCQTGSLLHDGVDHEIGRVGLYDVGGGRSAYDVGLGECLVIGGNSAEGGPGHIRDRRLSNGDGSSVRAQKARPGVVN